MRGSVARIGRYLARVAHIGIGERFDRLDALRAAYDRWSGDSPTDETTVARALDRVGAAPADRAADRLE